MNKKVQKILNILVIAFAIVSIATNVFAYQPKDVQATDPSSNTIQDTGNQIVGILRTAGVIISVVVLIIIGIKYMMGSAEEKAEYKKTFIPYIVGAALVFAASIFAQGIYEFFSGMTQA